MPQARIRHREPTCAFADAVMNAAEAAGALQGATQDDARFCLAAFLVTMEGGGKPEVVALASGTKFLPASLVAENKSHGRRVHDCHAEPLARRALLRWIHLQIRTLLDDEVAGTSTVPGLASTEEKASGASPSAAGRCVFHRPRGPPGTKLQLRPGVSLHLYSSSCPCGNASLRRWAQVGKGGDASLGALASQLPQSEWPQEAHPPLSRHALREGQVQLLVKRDPSAMNANPKGQGAMGQSSAGCDGEAVGLSDPDRSGGTDTGRQQGSGDESAAPSCDRWGMIAPGTEVPGCGAGVLLSCSDKIALWSTLGLQGALLSRFVSRLRLATITVHRKFSRKHLQRALCCRLAGWGAGGRAGDPGHHPVILCPTSVREFDVEGAGEGPDAFGCGKSVCWWAGAAQAVVLNGRNGLLWSDEATGRAPVEPQPDTPPDDRLSGAGWQPSRGGGSGSDDTCQGMSPLSKASMLDAYEDLCLRFGETMAPPDSSFSGPWDEVYLRVKQQACAQYEADREELLSSPLYFVPAEGTPGHPKGEKKRIGTGYCRKHKSVGRIPV